MKKAEQMAINAKIDALMANHPSMLNEFDIMFRHRRYGEQLRSCSAKVYNVGGYWILVSYKTVIAMIDQLDGTCYDFLRKVYGYTATSAQHISKFIQDYNANSHLVWRYV